MAKILLSEGLNHESVRKRIFDWGNDNGIFITPNLNDLIIKAKDDGVELRGDVDVWVSKGDVDEIVSRFDNKIVRCTALAMLCYSKVASNNKGEFAMPDRAITAWLGGRSRGTYQKAIRELSLFGYIDTVDRSGNLYRWKKKKMPDGTIYKIVAPVHSGKDFKIVDNDIWGLYNVAFAGK